MSRLRSMLPILEWLPRYDCRDLSGDLVAGLIVAVLLVPQGMAYAVLAGLPPEIGLYASILPLLVYGLLGTSRTLAVGPVAIVSLMVASSLGEIADSHTINPVAAAALLALLSGGLLLLMGIARLGFFMNFLSHPVISGFSSAAALVIGFSQLKHLLGLDIPRGHHITDTLGFALSHAEQINIWAGILGFGSVAILLTWRGAVLRWLTRSGAPDSLVKPVANAGPLAVVLVTTLTVWAMGLDDSGGVNIVADVPAGLPSLSTPPLDIALLRDLLPAALLTAIVGFLESVSVAKSLASKRRQTVDANQEMIALGAANIGASLSGGYPVAGGFGRSLVNFTAGAVTPLASLITAGLIALTVVALTPLLYYLPKAALAAIIVVAVAGLIDLKTLRETWIYNKADAASLIATFLAALVFSVEFGIIAGVALSLALYLWRTSRPHFAVVGRVGDTEHYRNVKRHAVTTWPDILAVRVDESLYFANTAALQDTLLAETVAQPEIRHLVLIMSAVNFIDASALETLETLSTRLGDAGVTLHFAEVKGPVMDRLDRVGFAQMHGIGNIYLSTHQAITDLRMRSDTE